MHGCLGGFLVQQSRLSDDCKAAFACLTFFIQTSTGDAQ